MEGMKMSLDSKELQDAIDSARECLARPVRSEEEVLVTFTRLANIASAVVAAITNVAEQMMHSFAALSNTIEALKAEGYEFDDEQDTDTPDGHVYGAGGNDEPGCEVVSESAEGQGN